MSPSPAAAPTRAPRDFGRATPISASAVAAHTARRFQPLNAPDATARPASTDTHIPKYAPRSLMSPSAPATLSVPPEPMNSRSAMTALSEHPIANVTRRFPTCFFVVTVFTTTKYTASPIRLCQTDLSIATPG